MPRLFDEFFLIDDVELEAMIQQASHEIGMTAQSVSSVDGSVTHGSKSDARRTMRALMRSYAARKGYPWVDPKIKYHVIRIASESVD